MRVAAANDAAQLHLTLPLLIVQGTADTTVPQLSSDALDKQLCASGATVRYDVYQGRTHRQVVPAAASDAVAGCKRALPEPPRRRTAAARQCRTVRDLAILG